MKPSILGLTLVAFLFAALSAGAASVEERAAELKKAINDEIASKPDAANVNGQRSAYDPRMVAAAIEQITSQLDNPNMGGNVDSQINQMLAGFTSDAVQKARQDFLEAIHLQQKEKADAAANRIKDFLKHVSEEVNKAKKPEDLDGLLIDLQKFQGDRYGGYSTENQALYQQVSGAFEFTKLWQNYLSHMDTEQYQQATNDLQNLSQNNYGLTIMPRSRILELLAPKKNMEDGKPAVPDPTTEAATLVKNLKSLDELEPTYEKLKQLRQESARAYDVPDLRSYVEVYKSIKLGMPTNITLYFNNSDSPVGIELRYQLLLYVLQHYFAPYKGPAPNETPDAYVARVIQDASKAQDWPLMRKALTARGYLDEHSQIRQFSTRDAVSGVDSLMAGLNQDDASQFALAVVSYQAALKSLSADIVPPKMIGDRLMAIQKDHPKEYEQGMQLVLAPPRSPYYPGTPGYPVSYPPNMRPGLTIPGVTNAAPAAVVPPAPNPAPAPASTNAPAAQSPPATTQ